MRPSCVLAAVLAALAIVGCAGPRDEVPPPTVFDRSEGELRVAMAKLTWRGRQRVPVPTVWFRTSDGRAPIDLFGVAQGGELYHNDPLWHEDDAAAPFVVTPAEMARVVRVAGAAPAQPAGGRRYLAVTAAREVGGRWEGDAIQLAEDAGAGFYRDVLAALDPGNRALRAAIIRQLWCVVPDDEWTRATGAGRPDE